MEGAKIYVENMMRLGMGRVAAVVGAVATSRVAVTSPIIGVALPPAFAP